MQIQHTITYSIQAEAILRGKLITINAYVNKIERSETTLHYT